MSRWGLLRMNTGFNYFSEKLYNNIVRINNIASGFAFMSHPQEIFYTIKDGTYNDKTIWETVSGRIGKLPTSTDDVYIRHTITSSSSNSVNNLFIASNGVYKNSTNALTLTVNAGIYVSGLIDFSLNTQNGLTLLGDTSTSYINNFNSGTSSTVAYNGARDQNILPVTYWQLNSTNTLQFKKYLPSVGISILGPLNITSNNVVAAGAGNLLFAGLVTLTNGGTLSLSGNPNVECRGGISWVGSTTVLGYNLGAGTWTFTTNNQTITLTNPLQINWQNIVVSGAITVTNAAIVGAAIVINGAIDGDNVSSIFLNKGEVNFNSTTYAMLTAGTFDITSFTNTVRYIYNNNGTLQYSTYSSLGIQGTGIKTLGANTTTNGTLTVNASTTNGFDCGTFNLIANGATTITNGTFFKSSAGSILFVGLLTFSNGGSLCSLDLSGGNPTVELRAGIFFNSNVPATVNFGTGGISFTTNSQSISGTAGITGTVTFNSIITVVGAITLTFANTSTSAINVLNQPIDCNNAGGSVVNKSTIYFNSTASLPSMTVGTFDRTTFSNVIGYTFNGALTLPYTTYNGLAIQGTGIKIFSGAATLGGSLAVTVGGTLTLAGNITVGTTTTVGDGSSICTFNILTYDATFTGQVNINNVHAVGAGIQKSGAGALVFKGLFIETNSTFDFSGNPTIEFQNGFTMAGGAYFGNLGTGQITCTTNSQTFNSQGPTVYTGNVLVSGAISLTLINAGSGIVHIFNGTLDCNNAGGSVINKTIISFATTASLPSMTVGTFDISSFANTVGYAMNGSINLPYTSYSGLTISGTGTKTLAGTTTVTAILTVSSGATLQLSTFNLTVTGTTSNTGSILKSGAGNVLFTGLLTLLSTSSLNLSTGNPTVELRGGFTTSGTGAITSGTGLWTLSTNNQTLTTGASITIDANILISGAITIFTDVSVNPLILNGTLDGNNASSIFDNRKVGLQYKNATAPMATAGKLYCNQAANTWLYNLNGAQDITVPQDPVSPGYKNLTLSVGGVKKLLGNVSVKGVYTLSAPATLNSNGFALTNP